MDTQSAAALLFRLAHNLERYLTNRFVPDFKVNAAGVRMISERQYHILFLIEYLGADTLSALAKAQHLSPSGLSTVISKMTANGLLTKNPFPEGRDGRTVIFEITPKGRRALHELTDEIMKNIERFYELLTPHELADFLAGHGLIRQMLFNEPPYTGEAMTAKQFRENVFRGFISIRRWSDAYAAKFSVKNPCAELSPEQFRMLYTVKDCGVRSIHEMANCMGLSDSAVSIAVKNLTKAGYMRKEKHEEGDGRRLQFDLTDHGMEVFDQKRDLFIAEFSQFYESLENPGMLYEAMQKLNNVFQNVNEREFGSGEPASRSPIQDRRI